MSFLNLSPVCESSIWSLFDLTLSLNNNQTRYLPTKQGTGKLIFFLLKDPNKMQYTNGEILSAERNSGA